MADEETRAAAPQPDGLRQRLGRGRFRRQVRKGFEAELGKIAKKPKSEIKAADVPDLVVGLTDADIDLKTDETIAAQSAGDDGQQRGPIIDWFRSHPELVSAVVASLLKAFLHV